MKKRIGILTGGGDVQPLNAIIASSIFTAKALNIELVGYGLIVILTSIKVILKLECIMFQSTTKLIYLMAGLAYAGRAGGLSQNQDGHITDKM